jgi:hypothetical protein
MVGASVEVDETGGRGGWTGRCADEGNAALTVSRSHFVEYKGLLKDRNLCSRRPDAHSSSTPYHSLTPRVGEGQGRGGTRETA